MKKFYSLFIASAVAFSAMAAGADDNNSLFINKLIPRKEKKSDIAFPGDVSLAPVSNHARGLRKADSNPSIEGWWTLYFGDYYNDMVSEFTAIPVSYVATLEGTTVTFTPQGDTKRLYVFKGEYDADALTLTFTRDYLFELSDLFFFQVPYHYNDKTMVAEDIDELVGTYNPDNNSIEFPIDCGLSWSGYETIEGDKYKGDIAMYDFILGFLFNPTASLEGEWELIGNVTFHDGWVIPAMGSAYADQNDYDVPFEQNVENPYIYRLVNPYLYGPVAPWNDSKGGYIVFDISDPDHVVFLPADAGFINYAIIGGITSFYCYNALGYEIVNNPTLSVQEIITLYDYIPFTTYKDNTVTLGSVTGEGETAYDANFGYQDAPLGGNFWNGVPMLASIKFPSWFNASVGTAVADPEKTEYFTINGMRTNNPAKGQIVIKRTGSKVTKEIIR